MGIDDISLLKLYICSSSYCSCWVNFYTAWPNIEHDTYTDFYLFLILFCFFHFFGSIRNYIKFRGGSVWEYLDVNTSTLHSQNATAIFLEVLHENSIFEVFLLRIFWHSDWIRRDSEPNAGKYRPEKLRIRTLLMQWESYANLLMMFKFV